MYCSYEYYVSNCHSCWSVIEVSSDETAIWLINISYQVLYMSTLCSYWQVHRAEDRWRNRLDTTSKLCLRRFTSLGIDSHSQTYPNPQVDSPPFAATVAAAGPLQLYQEDPVHQPLGLSVYKGHYTGCRL